MELSFFCSCCRHLYGFSESDLCYNGLLWSRQGHYKKNRSKKVRPIKEKKTSGLLSISVPIQVRYDLKRRYANLTRKQLDELLDRPDIVGAIKREPVGGGCRGGEDYVNSYARV